MSHNTDPGQYSLFDEQVSNEPADKGFPLKPIEGAGELPVKVSEAWEDNGSHDSYIAPSFEQQRALARQGIGNPKETAAIEARVKDHEFYLASPGMQSSIAELNPPRTQSAEEQSKIRAQIAIGKVLIHDTIIANQRRKQDS